MHISLGQIKRLFVDAGANYVFFVPLVIALTPVLWTLEGIQAYALAAIPISFIGSRTYTLFLKHLWYPLWKETF